MSSDYLYISDLIDELEELEEEQENRDLTDEEEARLKLLQAFDEEIDFSEAGKSYADGLIPEDCWKDYAIDYANDVGMVDRDSPMYNYIDWDAWADALQSDFSAVEFDGVTYFYS